MTNRKMAATENLHRLMGEAHDSSPTRCGESHHLPESENPGFLPEVWLHWNISPHSKSFRSSSFFVADRKMILVTAWAREGK